MSYKLDLIGDYGIMHKVNYRRQGTACALPCLLQNQNPWNRILWIQNSNLITRK